MDGARTKGEYVARVAPAPKDLPVFAEHRRQDQYDAGRLAPEGYRALNDCTRVWKDGQVEHRGWPRVEIRYGSGTSTPGTTKGTP